MQNESDQDRFARTALSSLEMTDQASAAVQKSKHRVSLADLKAKITDEQYINPAAAPHATICVCQTENGYVVVGLSAPADSENFDAELGKKFAMEDCLRQLWKLEGYLLRERLSL